MLEQFDYPRKNHEVVGKPDRKIIGAAGPLSERDMVHVFPEL